MFTAAQNSVLPDSRTPAQSLVFDSNSRCLPVAGFLATSRRAQIATERLSAAVECEVL